LQGGFCPECLAQMCIVRDSLISVTVQNWNNLQLSYSDLTYSTWPSSAILDYQRKHIANIVYAHTKFGENISISNKDMSPK